MAQVQGSGASQVKQLYSYDANGQLVSVNYNGTEYYYLRNGQTDIVGLMDASGNRVVEYIYDAWGKLISTTGTLATSLGADNPFRYRGYYYDTETGLYYLMTRYYDPEVCRFISADVYMTTGQGVLGGNMFAYCLNNPVNMFDSLGCSAESISATWWSTMWWLCGIDGLIPIGDVIYVVGGLLLMGVAAFTLSTAITASIPDKDKRLYGEPGTTNVEGYKETEIGEDGRATRERHNTDHGNPQKHSNPHDHEITWGNDGKPHFGPQINYYSVVPKSSPKITVKSKKSKTKTSSIKIVTKKTAHNRFTPINTLK